jgi:type IV pilus assembly protein PilY1
LFKVRWRYKHPKQASQIENPVFGSCALRATTVLIAFYCPEVAMKIHHLIASPLLLALLQTHAAVTDISTSPLVTSSTSSVLPNVLFILDDSGSMGWDFMPDWANDAHCKSVGGSYGTSCTSGHPPFHSGDFNGVMYNPAITYSPPKNADGSSRASQTAANTSTWTSVANDAYGIITTATTNLITGYTDREWCTDTSYTDCLRNDNYILPGTVNGKSYTTSRTVTATGSGSVATGAPDNPGVATRSFGPYYYTILPGEYCDSPTLRNCSATQGGAFIYPATLRWCDNATHATAASANPAAGSANYCQSVNTPGYNVARYPGKYFSAGTPGAAAIPAVPASSSFTISLSGCTNSRLAGVQTLTINGVNVLSSATGQTKTASTLASDLRARIGGGYVASGSSNTVKITAPVAAGAITHSVLMTRTASSHASCIITTNAATPAFSGYAAAIPAVPAVPGNYPGSFVRVDIVPSNNSYPYPGSTSKASTRTDCAGTTCTYAEEMTNFANWWAYYHTRMQMMKSSASISFNSLGKQYRVGYLSINNNTGSDFLNLASFDTTQKSNWYNKLFAAKANNSTPLRAALTKAGRLYGGKLNGSSLNGSTVVDPMQYSCQQNFTILSTDGYWNESSPGGYQLDGTTAIGNQDGSLVRPQLDGNNTSNTLADVAAYYYNTDLRTAPCTGSPVPPAVVGNDVCANNVPVSGLDAAAHQHMTTFTVGLGASGLMQYTPGYASSSNSDGDYFNIKNGTSANPGAGICSWQTTGVCNWPTPVSNTQSTIDDLWHTAVNGYGTYFSAGNPALLSSGLSSALAGVSARSGASAAATTSNPNIATGDNFVFSSTFTSVNWDGELVRQQLNLDTGAISTSVDWSAQAALDANTSRTIYTYDPTAGNKLRLFTWSTLGADQSWFNSAAITSLSQFCSSGVTCLGATEKAAAAGENLVNFVRGERNNEGSSTDISKYYRARSHVLGDIVSAEAVYVKTPLFSYTDAGYGGYKSANATRQGMVYVAANDGMLHAFNASTGAEEWAYIPNSVLPNLYKLADKNYATQHQYFVDGTPVQADVYFGGAWHTILVGGLAGGGRGYYALDVTNPAAPVALWEFTYDTSKGAGYTTDANLGYAFGKPEVTQLKDGTWVVLITSGYNNVSPGDGKGYLYVLNAQTGSKISTLSTNTGSTGTPSGLAQIRTWVDHPDSSNIALRVYGGDLLGNLWRFDIDNNVAPAGNESTLLATLKSSSLASQPITSKPELGLVNSYPVVYVGTGRYLGVTDLTDASAQSIYAVHDKLLPTGVGNPRTEGTFIKQTLTAATCPAGSAATICSAGQAVRTSTNLSVDFASNSGWYVDLLDSGERITNDPQLALGTIIFTANVPNVSACTIGGYSYLYYFNYKTGGPVATSTTQVTGTILGNSLATRPVFAKLPNNKVISITRLSDGSNTVSQPPVSLASGNVRRVSWRELFAE